MRRLVPMRPPKLAVLAAVLATAARADSFDKVREAAARHMQDRAVPSVAIAIAKNGQSLFEEAYGWANKEKPWPEVAAGLTGVQTLVPIMLDHVAKGRDCC